MLGPGVGHRGPAARAVADPQHEVGEAQVGDELPVPDQGPQPLDVGLVDVRVAADDVGDGGHGTEAGPITPRRGVAGRRRHRASSAEPHFTTLRSVRSATDSGARSRPGSLCTSSRMSARPVEGRGVRRLPLLDPRGGGAVRRRADDDGRQLLQRRVQVVAQRRPGQRLPPVGAGQLGDAGEDPVDGVAVGQGEVHVDDVLGGLVLAQRDLGHVEQAELLEERRPTARRGRPGTPMLQQRLGGRSSDLAALLPVDALAQRPAQRADHRREAGGLGLDVERVGAVLQQPPAGPVQQAPERQQQLQAGRRWAGARPG